MPVTAGRAEAGGEEGRAPRVQADPAVAPGATPARPPVPDTALGAGGDAGDQSWMRAGSCVELETAVFFPSDSTGVLEAIQVCETCVVRERCLEYALEQDVGLGIWGGVSERGRRRLRAARRAGTAPAAAGGSEREQSDSQPGQQSER